MSERTTSHHTIELRRTFDVPAPRVFAAWCDPAALTRWEVPGDAGWSANILALEFAVGGVKRSEFGPRGEAPFTEVSRYEDIVPDRRLCYAMTIGRGDVRLTTSMVTVEFLSRDRGTDLVVTEQLAILDGGDEREARENGWNETLDRLAGELRSPA
jgi:uncharacterized protein YndB with AHSA1/START domain